MLEECKTNEDIGENMEAHVVHMARPHEAAKLHLHIEEVGKITSLLLGLSGRLARVENALMGLPEDHTEKVRLYCNANLIYNDIRVRSLTCNDCIFCFHVYYATLFIVK